jgi:hypothetical protein
LYTNIGSHPLTLNFIYIRCGYPCAHVLKVTNELIIDMIKVQHWKLYATHYNEEALGIGLEFNKLQFHYSHYEGIEIMSSCYRKVNEITY